MNKQAVTTIISFSLVCAWAEQSAVAEPENKPKRSLAMTLPLAPAPHLVAHSTQPPRLVSRAVLRRKAAAAYPHTHFDRGQYFKGKGDINAALVEFLKASQENPRLVRAFYEQALIFRQKHYLKLAESSLEQALAVKPDYQDARILLATIRIDQGDVGAAMKELSRSLGIGAPENNQQSDTASSAPASQSQRITKATSQTAASSAPGNNGGTAESGASSPLSVERLLGKAPAVLQSLHSTLSEIPFFGNTTPPAAPHANAKKALINPALSSSQPDAPDSTAVQPGFSLRPYPTLPPKSAPSQPTIANRPQNQPTSKPNQALKVATAALSSKQKNAGQQPVAKSPAEDAAKPTSPSSDESSAANEAKNEDDVFVLRIPKSFKFLWQHKQPAVDATKEKQPKEKLQKDKAVAKTKRSASQADKPAKSDQSGTSATQSADKHAEGKSWLSHLFHAPTNDASSNGDADHSTSSEPIASKQPEHVQHAARKVKDVDEIKQFVLPPPPAGADTASANAAITAEKPLSAKPLSLDNESSGGANKKTAFAVPELPSAGSSLLAPLNKVSPSEHADEDEWTRRLRYLSEHGTASLKEGEAFMFAEDTGEATLFEPDGQTIRRQIAPTRSQDEIMRERRPDILIPDELMYNLSLLGKLMPKFGDQEKSADQSQSAPHADTTAGEATDPNFNVDNLMGDSQGFWGWLKHVFKF